MSKIIWGAGFLLAAAASGAAANWYADQKLTSYYEQAQLAKSVDEANIKYSNIQLGPFSGTADWVLTITPDPCKSNDVIVLHGQDKIQKKWNGYAIDSIYTLKSGNEKVKAALRGEQHAETHINWLGKSLTTVHLPRIDTQAEGLKIRIDPSQVHIYAASPANGESQVSKLIMDVPAFTVVKGPSQILAQKIQLETTQGLNQAEIESGYTRFTIGAFQRLDSNLSGGIKNIDLQLDTKVKEGKVSFDGSFKIGELNVPNSPLTKDIVMNLDVQNISLQRMQELSAILQKAQNSCASNEFLQEDASNAFLNIVNDGLDFESKNQMRMGDGLATANIAGKMMPGHHGSVQAFAKMLPSLLTFKAELEFDKNLFRVLTNSYAKATEDKMMSEQDIEAMFSSMETSGHAVRSGDSIQLLMDYQFGQKQFLDPKKN
ncbi:DUF945 family protein [Acinetobacter sp. CWB-B33]|uniref:DUF945 family protein n=1 Tax=Acinetobacter sp. CWB-B33 TaxID=2815724 RepID=UPI0031FE446B